jgi:Bromodomain
VSEKGIIEDYRSKIEHPMDLSTVTTKLESSSYTSLADFALDIRRIFANCLRYNVSMKDPLRPVAVQVLQTAEDLMTFFIARQEYPSQSYPSLLYCWKLCIDVLDTLFKIVNPSDGQPTALYFLYPVSVYCGGQFPSDYLEKVTRPMDFGSVTGNLLEGRYQTVEEFGSDCKLIVSNCSTYYSNHEDGKLYMEQAARLGASLSEQLEKLYRYNKSPKGIADRAKYAARVTDLKLMQPPISLLNGIIQDLRGLKYTDKATRITEPVMEPFEKPVSLTDFPDYVQYVTEPMDFGTVERKTLAGMYPTPEDFEYDVTLIFQNCEVYNSRRHGDHLVAMAKYGVRQFRRIFYLKIRAVEESAASAGNKAEKRAAQASPDKQTSSAPPPTKKIKVESSSTSQGKAAPRISISAINTASASTSSAAAAPPRSKSPKPAPPTTAPQPVPSAASQPPLPPKKSNSLPKPKPNQPVPLHIAIARVKEAFQSRRAVKSLQSWEADCAVRLFIYNVHKLIYCMPHDILSCLSHLPSRLYSVTLRTYYAIHGSLRTDPSSSFT